MALASFVQTNFLGGEISQTAQGRMETPAYKISLSVCLNSLPIEAGAWMRRPGTRHVATMRGGGQGRVIPFAFAQNYPYMMAFTDGFLRFATGNALVKTNDPQAVLAISAANPAVVQTTTAHGWTTGNQGRFDSLGVNNPLLQGRQFAITVVDATHFSIADAITGAAIDGSTLGAFVSGNFARFLELVTTYTAGSWASLRSVQAETRALLLNGTKPQVLQVSSLPTPTQFANFTLGAADFIDGPYLDPIVGSYVTSTAANGVVTLTLAFAPYDSTRAYNVGDYVTNIGVGYKSLTALNQGNTPAGSPTNWLAVNAGAPVNGGTGFVASDIGRLLRLFSEPQLWTVAGTYSAKDVVALVDGSGGSTYWTATASVAAGIQPGTSTLWALNVAAAQWTWAQVTGVSGSGLIAPATALATMSQATNAFDGTTNKSYTNCANYSLAIQTFLSWSAVSWASGSVCQYNGYEYQALLTLVTSSGLPVYNSVNTYPLHTQVQYGNIAYQLNVLPPAYPVPPPPDTRYWSVLYGITADPPPVTAGTFWALQGPMTSPTVSNYIGQTYAGSNAIQSATLYPSNDLGFTNALGHVLTINLRAKATSPANAADGTLLGTAGTIGNTFSPITIVSSDQVSTWKNVWFEIILTWNQPLFDDGSHVFTGRLGVAQAQFTSPNVANGSVCTAQIRGGALVNGTQQIRLWRLGVYSDTTGWPTCGAYHEGRVWLGGVVSNRFDASVSNGFIPGSVELDFTPTTPNGIVTDANAISYTCTGKDVNQFLWMEADQEGVLAGTQAGPWLISAPTPGAMTPTNIKAVRVPGPGSQNIEPKRAEHTLLYVQRFARKVVEMFPDVYSGKYSAPNLTERAKHLTVGGVAEIAYQQELVPCIWARRANGGLIGATYKRDTLTTSQGPNIIGWHRHILGSGRAVESLCVGPSTGGTLDTLALVTNDTSNSIRHIEVMTDLLDEGFALTDCWFVDNGIVPTSTVVQAAPTGGQSGSLLVNGLWALNGKQVTAYIAGLDCGDYTVVNGSITVPFGSGVDDGTGISLFTAALVQSFGTLPAVVGFTYTSQGQMVRPVSQADTGAQAGPGFAKIGRAHKAAALFYCAVNGTISFGSDFVKMYPVKLLSPGGRKFAADEQWSGIWRDQVNSALDFDGQLAWQITRPNPGFLMAVGGFDSKADV